MKFRKPVSVMLEYWIFFARFVRIKSIKDGSKGFFQLVALVIKLVREYKFQKYLQTVCYMSKSPKNIFS